MSATEQNVINGKYGRVWINGYEMLIVESFNLDLKIDRETIKGTGKRASKKVYRETDTEITGKLKVKSVDSMGLKAYIRNLKKGIDEPITIEASLSDPNIYNGQIETTSFEAYITGMPLQAWENGSFVEREISFSVDPSTFDFDALISTGRDDMLTK